jgi:2-keto-3-deoxy-L-fuconate dehydrogenase
LDRLKGKRAIVTGAGQGIGRAAAELFVTEGAEVIALDRNADTLMHVAGVTAYVIDLTDRRAIAAFGEQAGDVDILFNCAGYVDAGMLLDTNDGGYDLSFDLNVHAVTHMLTALLPAMIARGGGSIINMSSVAGAVIGVGNRYAYCASKAAVAGITRSVALDYVGHGIRCNAICPGTVQSPSLDERLAATGDEAKARSEFVARQPMRRLGSAAEVSALALYLASDESAYTTGQLHVIDGGWCMA